MVPPPVASTAMPMNKKVTSHESRVAKKVESLEPGVWSQQKNREKESVEIRVHPWFQKVFDSFVLIRVIRGPSFLFF